ncbi:hypothetical protein MKW92_012642 [Papaver armeniacum]|nr:hypothetical protein MKW92_015327 [Papaver armeniacum]KAI3897625.1 hypothetical protein MKW92_012642 [Papaver armeniacum]
MVVIVPQIGNEVLIVHYLLQLIQWLVLFFVVSFASGAAAGAVIYLKKFFGKNDRDTRKFQQLSQMQARDFLDDDDEESFVPHIVHTMMMLIFEYRSVT